MDIFFSATANYINHIQLAHSTPASTPPKPTSGQGSTVDSNGTGAPQKGNRSGSMDSLGKGNVL